MLESLILVTVTLERFPAYLSNVNCECTSPNEVNKLRNTLQSLKSENDFFRIKFQNAKDVIIWGQIIKPDYCNAK